MLLEILKKIGFSDKEAKVYLASLQVGAQPVSLIAKKAGLNRSTTYVILEQLKEKGAASQFVKQNIKYFNVIPPEDLISYINRIKKDLETQASIVLKLLPQFINLINPNTGKPRVKFFEGVEGIKEVYEDTISEGISAIHSFWGTDVMPKNIKEYLEKNYIPRRVKKNIPFYVIAPTGAYGKKMKKTAKQLKRFISLIPAHQYPFEIEINIYGEKIAFFSYKENELMAIIVESEAIANTMRSIHKLCWDAYHNK